MKKILLSFAALAALVSCVKENPVVDENQNSAPAQTQSISFEAVAPSSSDEADTKTTLVDHSLVHWSKGDAVKVLFIPNAGWGATLYEADQTIGANAVMTATFESESSASAFFTVDEFSWGHGIEYMMDSGIALYPATVNASSIRPKGNYMYANTTTITYELPSVQEAVENSFKSGVLFSYAKIEDKTEFATNQSKLNFKNGCALIKITLPADAVDIVSVKVESANADLAGEKKVTDLAKTTQMPNFDSEGRLGALSAVNTVKHITLSAPTGETLKAGASYYIVTWPGTHSNGLTFTFTNSAGLPLTKQVSQEVVLEASKIDHFHFKNSFTFEHIFEVSEDNFNFEGTASNGSFTVTSSRNWTATSDSDWLTVSPVSGSSSMTAATISFNATQNNSGAERTAKITITAGADTKVVTVTQAAFVPELSIERYGSWNILPREGDWQYVTIKSNTGWTLSCDQDWLTLETTSGKATAGETIKLTATENTTTSERTATLYLRDNANTVEKTFTVTQQAGKKTSGYKVVASVLPEDLETGKYYVIANYGDPTRYWTIGAADNYDLTLQGGFNANAYNNEFSIDQVFYVSSIVKKEGLNDQYYEHKAKILLVSHKSDKAMQYVNSTGTYKFNYQLSWAKYLFLGARWGGETNNSVDMTEESQDLYINTPDGNSSKITRSNSGFSNTGQRKWLIYEVQ